MKNHIFWIAFMAATLLLAGCGKDEFTPQGCKITFTNDGIVEERPLVGGMYYVSRHGDEYFNLTATECIPTPPEGRYAVLFNSATPTNGIIAVDGKDPIFVGTTDFHVPGATSVNVHVERITAEIRFQIKKGISVSAVKLLGTPSSIYISGEPASSEPEQINLSGNDLHNRQIVAAQDIIVMASIDDGKTLETIKTVFDAKRGRQYTIEIYGGGISVFPK